MPASRREKANHPGVTILKALALSHLTQADLSRATGYSRKHINLVVNAKVNLTPMCAVKIGEALGIPPRSLMEEDVAWFFDQYEEIRRAARQVA